MSSNDNPVPAMLALLIIQPIPANLYARVCVHFDTEVRGCTYEQIKAYMRHELTNYDALRKLHHLSGSQYVEFKAEVVRRTEVFYQEWRAK